MNLYAQTSEEDLKIELVQSFLSLAIGHEEDCGIYDRTLQREGRFRVLLQPLYDKCARCHHNHKSLIAERRDSGPSDE